MFTANTMVDLAGEARIEIENIKIGDIVATDNNGKDSVTVVFASFEKTMLRLEISSRDSLTLTKNQKVYTPCGDIMAKNLLVGSDVFTKNGVASVTSTRVIEHNDNVYGFHCLSSNAAVCNGFLVKMQ